MCVCLFGVVCVCGVCVCVCVFIWVCVCYEPDFMDLGSLASNYTSNEL